MDIDATLVQKMPTGTETSRDVGFAVYKALLERDYWLLSEDHEARIQFGEKKYGQRLKANNGRDAKLDLLQELLDALSYSMQAYLEGGSDYLDIFNRIADLTQEVRNKIEFEATYQ